MSWKSLLLGDEIKEEIQNGKLFFKYVSIKGFVSRI